MGRLEGKVAIITGAASGMGRSAALLFAAEGADLVLADLNSTGGEEVAHGAAQQGGKCVFLRCDVAEEDDVRAAVSRALSEFGGLNVTFNNAGIGGARAAIEDMSLADWDRTHAVCLRGAFLGIKHSVAPMRQQGGGSIICTTSIAGLGGFPHLHAYSAAKAGVVNLVRSTALQLGRDYIRVNAVAPGSTSTPMAYGQGDPDEVARYFAGHQPIPRAGMPEDIAQAALFLASDASSFITGQTIAVDGGASSGAFSAMPQPGEPDDPSQMTFAGPSFER